MSNNDSRAYSPGREFLKKFKKQRQALVSLVVIFIIIGIALIGPYIAPYDPGRPVIEQYEEKGLSSSEQTDIVLPIKGILSNGEVLTLAQIKEKYPDLTFSAESVNRKVVAVRAVNEGVKMTASGSGTTQVTFSDGNTSSIFKANVSVDDEKAFISQLLVSNPLEKALNTGEQYQIEVKSIMTDKKELTHHCIIEAYSEDIKQYEQEQQKIGISSAAFGSSGVTVEKSLIKYESMDKNIATVTNQGLIEAVGNGVTQIKVQVDSLSTIINVGVGETAANPTIIAYTSEPVQSQADIDANVKPNPMLVKLSDVYKHQKPSSKHLFGTDHQNRDIFSRILHGTSQTLIIGFVSVLIGSVVGTVLGLMAGYFGRWVDTLITRFTDILLAFPGLLLAIAVIAILGPGLVNIIIAVATFTVPIFIRIVRGSTLALKEMTYVEAARAIGVSDFTIIFRHIFPGTISVVLVYLTMRIGSAILIGASLSFLGLGGDVTAPEWGSMINAAKDNSRNVFHPMFFPGLAIVITVLSFNLLGDGVRDALDPKLKD